MLHTITIETSAPFSFQSFADTVGLNLQVQYTGTFEDSTFYYFTQSADSGTLFCLTDDHQGHLELILDALASYSDYKLFPYLADSLNHHLNGCRLLVPDDRGEAVSVYEQYNEDWIEDSIGEEIAILKSVLSIAPRYYPALPRKEHTCITLPALLAMGVTLHSSTPRIYGYLQYLLRRDRLPEASESDLLQDQQLDEQNFEVDVPQHHSIGRVKSWQTDGSETWESYAQEDVDQLLRIAENYRKGVPADGVVLNDLGTLYQEGIGVEADGPTAAYWFREAIRQGDHLYAPSNLGDLYRKGAPNLPASLPQAFEAYLLSTDPYAAYRIGQAYEEGWTGTPDSEKAREWYEKAAAQKHHLALKRLQRGFPDTGNTDSLQSPGSPK